MREPPDLDDELLRLQALRDLKILDTESEERFDRVTRLAQKMFHAPIALVSLVDSDRQWFKSRQGIDASETPREILFCGHAIASDEVMVVGDSTKDERFCDNPLVTLDPNIRFYAGYPLKAPDGHRVGTLCVIDRVPRDPEDFDTDALAELGKIVEDELAVTDMVRDDPLTGLANRRGFLEIGRHLLAICERAKSPAALALVHFRNHDAIEVSLGQEPADRAMIELSQIVMAVTRSSDLLARVGPDTLAVLLAGASASAADALFDRISRRVDVRNFADAGEYTIDLDLYQAQYDPGRNPAIAALLEMAEQRMTGTGQYEGLSATSAGA